MSDSLFNSAAFIIVEIGLTIVTLIGEFYLSLKGLHQLIVLTKDRFVLPAAYEFWIGDFIWTKEEKQRATIQTQRAVGIGYEPLYNTSRREYYDRSLSATQKENKTGSSRRTSSQDDGYDRTTNPGRGSTGDSTRRLVSSKKLLLILGDFERN